MSVIHKMGVKQLHAKARQLGVLNPEHSNKDDLADRVQARVELQARLPDSTRDREIIEDPATWPLDYKLPVKNFAWDSTERPNLGVLLPDNLTRVYLANYYDMPPAPVASDYPHLKRLDYDSVEALAAGWRVD